MNVIKLLAETAEAVTISRADLDALIDAAENAGDQASVRAWMAHVAAVGRDAAHHAACGCRVRD
jgi:class 3 adenylate cyclase